jgi:hypothetical protein
MYGTYEVRNLKLGCTPHPNYALKVAAWLYEYADPGTQNYEAQGYLHLCARFYKRSSLDYFMNCLTAVGLFYLLSLQVFKSCYSPPRLFRIQHGSFGVTAHGPLAGEVC